MTEADRLFDRFPDFIKEYIYSHSWESLREVQIAAAECIFETDHDLLLTSSTASGKTEAVFSFCSVCTTVSGAKAAVFHIRNIVFNHKYLSFPVYFSINGRIFIYILIKFCGRMSIN